MSRKVWYSIIGSSVVLAFLITTVFVCNAKNVENEQKLMYELSELRSIVLIYQKTYKKWPESLNQALNEKYVFATPAWNFEINKDGFPLDPFGNPYNYDSTTGRISSSSKKYLNW